MPPRRRRASGTREPLWDFSLWDFSVVCIGLFLFRLMFVSYSVKRSVEIGGPTSAASSAQSSSAQSSLTHSAQNPRTTSPQNELMRGRGYEELGDGDINNDDIHDFDVVASLTNIVDHPRRFLRAKYVNTARVLLENVTAPMFEEIASGQMHNGTADLENWLMKDITGICLKSVDGIRYKIASLTLQQRRCGVDDFTGLRPLIEATSEEADSSDARCSLENVEERIELLRILWDLEKNLDPACDEAQHTIADNLGTLHRFRQGLMSTTAGVVSELKSLLDAFAFFLRADDGMDEHAQEIAQHLINSHNMGGVRLEVLASRPATRCSGDLDAFTALVLHLILGSSLVSSDTDLLITSPQYMVDATQNGEALPVRAVIRLELNRQGQAFNKTSELLSSSILPGVRELLAVFKEASTEVFETSSDDDEATEYFDPDDPHGGQMMNWIKQPGWADADSADRLIRGIGDGADHLEFLMGYLARLRSGVPGMLARLDDWDADVDRLAAELKMVVSSGRRYTAQILEHPRSDVDAREATWHITRWQVPPQDLESIWLGLGKLLRVFEDARARVEDFNPQDHWQDHWFERQMHRWSRERAALRAEWVDSRSPKEPTKPAKNGFWERILGS